MRETRLTCDKFEFISILEVKGRKAPNEHASLYVKGHIAADNDDYVLRSLVGQGVKFTASDWDGDQLIFNGLIDEIDIHTENEMRILTVNVVSRSVLMDIQPEIRTFQDDNMLHQTVTDRMSEKNPDFNFIWPTHGDVPIGAMKVQYNVNDWNYAQQLASGQNLVVIPDYLLDKPYVAMGKTKRAAKPGINAISYKIKKDLRQYRDNQPAGGFAERDAIYYIVKSREIFDLCDPIPFLGLSLFVYAIDTIYDGDQLVHYYTLKEEDGFHAKKFYNENLIGVSLRGEVIEVAQDVVRVKIFDDVEQTEHKWFPYATPFSQPNGKGWYFMPELDDEIRLQFPSEKEDDPYVSSAVHISHGNRSNPEIKFIRTIYGQVIQFDPEKILIDDGAGSSITLHMAEGITIETDKMLNVDAQGEIVMSAFGQLLLTGEGEGVVIQKGDAVISVNDAIDLSAEHIRIQ